MGEPTPNNPPNPQGEIIPPEIIKDAFAEAITELARTQNLKTILEIGASSGDGSTEAWMKGLRQNPAPPTLYCIEMSPARADALRARWANEPRLKAYVVSSVPREGWASEQEVIAFYQGHPGELNVVPLDEILRWRRENLRDLDLWKVPENGIKRIREENGIAQFDAVLIDGSEFTGPAELDAVYGSRFILLDDVRSLKNLMNYRRLLEDPRYTLVRCELRLRSGFAIFQLLDDSPLIWPARDPLPVHFLTIVLNGEPFIRHHIEEMKKLPFSWHWHIVEGMAALRNDTGWSVPAGGRLPVEMQQSGRSIDGSSAYLDKIIMENPGRITVYRKNPGELFDGKKEMVSAPLPFIDCECVLWEIDVDELWTAEQFIAGRKLFFENPEKTAAFFWCHFFVGPDRVISTRGGYGNNPAGEWLRAWRFRPGMFWATHEPPLLAEQINPKEARDVGRVNPFPHAETERAGLTFQHFGYVLPEQLKFKEIYYGYRGALQRWKALQLATDFPILLRNYFPWVQDDSRVDRAEKFVPHPLIKIPAPDLSGWWAGNPQEIPKPRIAIDGLFYQFYSTGIGRVWIELMREWIGDGFAEHIVMLDRAGSAPVLEGIRRVLIPPMDMRDVNADRVRLQEICNRLGIDLFTSTYYSSPISTPSLFMLHDMIPEVAGVDLNEPFWKLKHEGIRHASAIYSVSEASKRDLLRFFPQIPPEKVVVSHNGVRPTFRPRTTQEVREFAARYGITKPYFLIVGARGGYKNTRLIFEALRQFKDAGNFDLVLTGGFALEGEYVDLVAPGCTPHVVHLNDEDLCLAYAGAIALLHPSLYEGFGLPLAEAMACACPVITCANSSLTEIGGDAVVYVPPDNPDAMARAILEICRLEKRNALITAGIDRARRFSWPAAAFRFKSLLLEVAEKKSARANHNA